MTAYLGLDVGGTGSRWALVDACGAVATRGVAGGATGHLFSDAPRAQFMTTLTEIAVATQGTKVAGAVAGVTGLGAPSARAARDALAQTFGISENAIEVMDDIELACRLLFPDGGGHLISAGTCSVGMHIDADGAVVRVGGRGILIDDAGSGTWIALRALDLVWRDIDRHGSPGETATLADALFEMVGGATWDDVRVYIYGSERGRIGELAQAVATAADKGNEIASGILADAGRELARLSHAMTARCGPAPIAVIGRISSLSPILRNSLTAALPGADLSFLTVDLAMGAAMMASGDVRAMALTASGD